MTDPIRARRAKVARWSLLANRIGYLFLAVAVAVFVIGFALGFTPPVVAIVLATLLIGCALLLPSIISGLAPQGGQANGWIGSVLVEHKPQLVQLIFGLLVILLLIFAPGGVAGLGRKLKVLLVPEPR